MHLVGGIRKSIPTTSSQKQSNLNINFTFYFKWRLFSSLKSFVLHVLSLSMQGPVLFYMKYVCTALPSSQSQPLFPSLQRSSSNVLTICSSVNIYPPQACSFLGSVCIRFKCTRMGSRLTSHFICFLFYSKPGLSV